MDAFIVPGVHFTTAVSPEQQAELTTSGPSAVTCGNGVAYGRIDHDYIFPIAMGATQLVGDETHVARITGPLLLERALQRAHFPGVHMASVYARFGQSLELHRSQAITMRQPNIPFLINGITSTAFAYRFEPFNELYQDINLDFSCSVAEYSILEIILGAGSYIPTEISWQGRGTTSFKAFTYYLIDTIISPSSTRILLANSTNVVSGSFRVQFKKPPAPSPQALHLRGIRLFQRQERTPPELKLSTYPLTSCTATLYDLLPSTSNTLATLEVQQYTAKCNLVVYNVLLHGIGWLTAQFPAQQQRQAPVSLQINEGLVGTALENANQVSARLLGLHNDIRNLSQQSIAAKEGRLDFQDAYSNYLHIRNVEVESIASGALEWSVLPDLFLVHAARMSVQSEVVLHGHPLEVSVHNPSRATLDASITLLDGSVLGMLNSSSEVSIVRIPTQSLAPGHVRLVLEVQNKGFLPSHPLDITLVQCGVSFDRFPPLPHSSTSGEATSLHVSMEVLPSHQQSTLINRAYGEAFSGAYSIESMQLTTVNSTPLLPPYSQPGMAWQTIDEAGVQAWKLEADSHVVASPLTGFGPPPPHSGITFYVCAKGSCSIVLQRDEDDFTLTLQADDQTGKLHLHINDTQFTVDHCAVPLDAFTVVCVLQMSASVTTVSLVFNSKVVLHSESFTTPAGVLADGEGQFTCTWSRESNHPLVYAARLFSAAFSENDVNRLLLHLRRHAGVPYNLQKAEVRLVSTYNEVSNLSMVHAYLEVQRSFTDSQGLVSSDNTKIPVRLFTKFVRFNIRPVISSPTEPDRKQIQMTVESGYPVTYTGNEESTQRVYVSIPQAGGAVTVYPIINQFDTGTVGEDVITVELYPDTVELLNTVLDQDVYLTIPAGAFYAHQESPAVGSYEQSFNITQSPLTSSVHNLTFYG